MERQTGITIKGFYKKTLFESENGYRIILVKGDRGDIQYPSTNKTEKMIDFTVKGKFAAPAYRNQGLELIGEWVKEKKSNTFFFNVFYLISPLPQTKEEIKSFLMSVKGVGEKTARKIAESFSNNFNCFQDNELELIAKIKGLTKTTAKNIEKAIRDINVKEELERLLKGCVDGESVSRIIAKYGTDSLDVVKTDPFKLTQDKVLSFPRSDAIYLFLGGKKEDKRRIENGIISAMKLKRNYLGSNIVPKEDLLNQSISYLQLEEEDIKAAINSLCQKKSLIHAGDFLYLYDDYINEKNLAKIVAKYVVDRPAEVKVKYLLNHFDLWKKKRSDIALSSEQEQAVESFAENYISIITGGPGTGKSTVLKAIIETYNSAYGNNNIRLMAPTGLAAKRMTDICGFPAETIHKQFGLVPSDNDVGFNDSNGLTINAGLIVIDEFSMVGIDLAGYIFRSIEWNPKTRIVIVGDSDQLPAVSIGRVLEGFINSRQIKVTRLTRNFRQEAGSNIIDAAIAINNGDTNIAYKGNFVFKEVNDADTRTRVNKIIEEIKSAFLESIKKYGLYQTFILTPKRAVKTDKETGKVAVNSMLSSAYLNPIVRDLINPPSADKKSYKSGSKIFRVGDRVINLQNSEDLMNGEIGFIVDIVQEGAKSITVKFDDKEIEFTPDKIKHLDLAYCITVHKSQGNEFDSVIYPTAMVNSPMLVRNLLYTAVTRAKKEVVLVGEKESIEKSILTVAATYKRDLLAARIAREKSNLMI